VDKSETTNLPPVETSSCGWESAEGCWYNIRPSADFSQALYNLAVRDSSDGNQYLGRTRLIYSGEMLFFGLATAR
jgi:hypothetical protein